MNKGMFTLFSEKKRKKDTLPRTETLPKTEHTKRMIWRSCTIQSGNLYKKNQ